MKLLRLYALNFKKLRFDKPLEFREGVTLISGLNEAGKSSILDSILYALFGRVIRPPKPRNEDLIAYGFTEAVVWLEFEIDGRRFQVERRVHRTKPSKAHLYEVLPNGEQKPLATEARKVTETVEKLLGGITFDEIVSSNVVAQKDLNRLIQQRGGDRKRVINIFLNLESFNIVSELLNEERKDLEGTGPARPGRINNEREKLEALRRELQELRRREQEIDALTAENSRLYTELEDLKKKYEETSKIHLLLTEYDEALKKRGEIESLIKLRQQTITEYHEQVKSLEGRILEIGRKLEAYNGLDESLSVLKEAQKKVDEIKTMETRLQELQNRRTSLENEVSALRKELRGLTFDELADKLEGLKQNRKRIRPLAIGTSITFVLAALTFPSITMFAVILFAVGGVLLAFLTLHLARVTRHTQLQELIAVFQLLKAKERELIDLKGQLEGLMLGKAGAESQLQHTCAMVVRYGHIYREYADKPVEAVKAMLAEAMDEDKKRGELLAKADSLNDEIRRIKARIDVSALEAEIKRLEDQLSLTTLPALPEEIKFSRELLREKAEEKERLSGEVIARQTMMEKNQDAIEENRKFLDEHADIAEKVGAQEKLVQAIERRIKVLRRAIEAIELTAESLRSRVRPAVENYMGLILPAITSGRYKAVRLDEGYNLEVWDPEAGEFRPKEVFSGGTEDQFLLAMRLAFALALLPEVKGMKPEFLFLDEPLGSSDEARRSGILEYLRSGLSETFKQVFLISHLMGLEEVVDNIIRLENGTPM